MAFEIDIGFASLAGRKPVNEDFCAAMLPERGQDSLGSILAIADGVSTGGMGKEAAQTTVTSLVRDYYGTPPTWDTTVALDRVISAQNTWLCGINQRRSPALGLTTLTALVLQGHTWTLAHVGDTRAYLFRDGVITQLSHDHVVRHPDFSHQLLRSIGAEDHVVVDYSQGELQVGDVFVLASDGVHGTLSAQQLQDLLGLEAVQDTCQRLVDAALIQGATDNLTAMVARVVALQDMNLQDVADRSQTLPVPSKLKVGDILDGLRVIRIVADSGINIVYQVTDSEGLHAYALKTLHPARAHDAQERAMLVHEGWLARHVQTGRAGQHLVAVHDHPPSSAQRSALYLLYDWHEGETLQQGLDRGVRSSPTQVIDAMQQALKVLGYLHRQGVVHRDVKPANLHLGHDGSLRLLDLGVALSGKEPEAMRRLHAGTPSYVNPEQWGYSAAGGVANDELPTAQSDLYALGVTLYQLLTGRLPYGEVLPHQTGRFFRDPPAPSRTNPQVPIWLDHIALKAVARDRRQRFETAEEMLLALERGASRPISAPLPSSLIQRDPSAVWKLALALSVIFNLMLVYWLLFLPK
ncbi:MAG: hypothetical protein RLZZ126_1273 [Pseudomonadota bacterium]|jgi:serine/threonine protein phosphatase PrpC